ncbi:SLIRP isoform 6, partial [Pan troglodytes]
AASAARGAAALRRSINQPVAFVRRIPWTAASRIIVHIAQ